MNNVLRLSHYIKWNHGSGKAGVERLDREFEAPTIMIVTTRRPILRKI